MPTKIRVRNDRKYLYFWYYDATTKRKKELYCGLADDPQSLAKAREFERSRLEKQIANLSERIASLRAMPASMARLRARTATLGLDLETRLGYIRQIGEEIVTEEELRTLLETNEQPTAYDRLEPGGLAHLASGVLRPIIINDMLKAGVRMKLLIADGLAWVNNKMERIREFSRYHIEVWKAAGVDMSKVDVVWESDTVRNEEYWKKVMTVAQNSTLARAQRALTIAGPTKTWFRRGSDEKGLVQMSQLFYPMMEVAEIFWFDVDICQLGIDQRRTSMLAREVADKLGWKKPVAIHHHLLAGLGAPRSSGLDENAAIDREISSKMSKSKRDTSIFVHDSAEEISRKVSKAWCPEKVTEGNPVLQYSKYIIFRKLKSLKIERLEKYGGNIEFFNFQELERAYAEGRLNSTDLKRGVGIALDEIISPIREHFVKAPSERNLYETVRAEH